ncbi:MAG: hypothetical protein Q8874_02910, partial [Sweet potato little leaf phytoplasma]|nr:hypothetical protein [Sweet potato little leaf phytoplasma]
LSKLRKQFIKFGNSLIVILNEKLLKIHIHTNKPDVPIQFDDEIHEWIIASQQSQFHVLVV